MVVLDATVGEATSAGHALDGPPMSEHARDDTGGIEADRTVGERITALATADTFIVYD